MRTDLSSFELELSLIDLTEPITAGGIADKFIFWKYLCIDFSTFALGPIIFFIFAVILIVVCVCIRMHYMRSAWHHQPHLRPVNLQPVPATGEYYNCC